MSSAVLHEYPFNLPAPITLVLGVVGIIIARRRLVAGRGLDHAGGRGTGGG